MAKHRSRAFWLPFVAVLVASFWFPLRTVCNFNITALEAMHHQAYIGVIAATVVGVAIGLASVAIRRA
jgi:uncharacterized membrane protein